MGRDFYQTGPVASRISKNSVDFSPESYIIDNTNIVMNPIRKRYPLSFAAATVSNTTPWTEVFCG